HTFYPLHLTTPVRSHPYTSLPSLFFFLMLPPPPTSTLFPYTTLFRSERDSPSHRTVAAAGHSALNLNRTAELFGACGHVESMQRSEEHTSELQSQSNLVCRLLLEKKKK